METIEQSTGTELAIGNIKKLVDNIETVIRGKTHADTTDCNSFAGKRSYINRR